MLERVISLPDRQPRIRPLPSTITLSDISRISSISSLIRTTAHPLSRTASNARLVSAVVPTSSPRVGYDAMMHFSANAMANDNMTRWILPPDNCERMRFDGGIRSPTSAACFWMRFPAPETS
ncbi:hypothetical protein BBOU_0193 [Bifidobacterium boum]|uniref:Uncharacterized protein n=1 Tax=Bifidobacterium boum TaxID=78343 RepID=A0A086ZRE3_9BIFI|nr:hypothetical protein BBOU_0193 [Bifidobacterium boum]